MISILDINESCKGSALTLRESEEYFRSGLLLCAGVKGRKGNLVKCVALASPTSNIFNRPHEVQAIIDVANEDGRRVRDVQCNCQAEDSKQCKHCVALLIYLNRVNEEDLDELTSSDLEQQWNILNNKQKTALGVKPAVADICECNEPQSSQVVEVTEEMKKTWRNILLNSNSS